MTKIKNLAPNEAYLLTTALALEGHRAIWYRDRRGARVIAITDAPAHVAASLLRSVAP